jgi:hypothetical protein
VGARFEQIWWIYLLNQLVDLDAFLYCGNGIKGDLDHYKMAVFLFVPH